MCEKGNTLIDRILGGNDAIFNMTSHLSSSLEMAICVRLQTDYAGWLGMRQFFNQMQEAARAALAQAEEVTK